MLPRKVTQEEIDKIREVYHKFPEKEITKEMIFEARRVTYLGLAECKRILTDYIKELKKIYEEKKQQPVKVAVLGQSGVGKTTTVNNLFNANFKTSRTVVGTDKAQYKDFELGDGSIITIVDLPGYGRSVAEDKEYQQIYISELKHCDIILLIVQANDKALVDDQYMIECLYEWSKEGLI